MFGGSGGCNPDITKPQVFNWCTGPIGGFLAQVFGGSEAAEAVITTESGNAVSVLAAAGYAHAEWPSDWGKPQTVGFYTRDGELLSNLDFDPEIGGQAMRTILLIGAATLLVLTGCGGDDAAQPAEAGVVALTFDGTTCSYDGPARVPAGTVDFRFTNTSDQPFAASAISVEDWALADFLSEGEVGTDWDIPFGHPRGGGIEWYNRWPQVPGGEAREYSWMFPAGTYYFDCVLELDHVWRAAKLEVLAETDEAVAATTQPAHVVGGDLLLAMQPGEGTESDLGRSFVEMFDREGTFGLREGTANHVGWIDTEYGPRHIVKFTAGRENPRGGEPESCIIIFPGGGGCGIDPDEPAVYGWSDGEADAFGGDNAAEAVISTESGKTVSIVTIAGHLHAEWPFEWGMPQIVDFYNADGDLLLSLEFQLESEG
jgi:hypothetical protein